ncbi:MAG: NAD(P)H-hydrate dehydratase [Chloroflexi bacterium]|nr:NAD(P)H-hydrate dehydratase [Chloroflexota bacterium]
MKMVSVSEMVAMERATDASGFTYDQMMAAAGRALADVILSYAPFNGPILFLIGPGNNGGDGLVACARVQQAGATAIPYIWKRKQPNDPLVAAVNDAIWAEQDPDFATLAELVGRSDIIVDALLGTGNTRAIGGSLAELLRAVHSAMNESRSAQPPLIDPAHPREPKQVRVIACDCPSGLFCDTGEIDPLALHANHTVTFALPKYGHFLQPGAAACGRLTIADIHIDRGLAPDDAPDVLTPDEVAAMLPKRPPTAHKGTFGRALIVAGSANFPGAAAIACRAAYRVGAGLAHLAAASVVGQLVAGQLPEPVHTVLPSDMGAIQPDAVPILEPLLENHKALLVGPGLGTERRTVEFVEAFLTGRLHARRAIGFLAPTENDTRERPTLPPLVVDADGLNALAKLDSGPAALPPHSILTPHPGEMSRLTGLSTKEINANRWDVARRFAAEWNQIVVLKGAFTAIAHPDGALAISPFANAALATAGSGDVLAGALVGLLSQGLAPWDAARAGVYLHALAGQLASEAIGPALLASDIAQYLPQALAQLRR